MKHKKLLATVAAAVAFAIPAAASAGICWNDADCAQKYNARVEETVGKNMPYVQASVSGFFNTLGLKPAQTKAGLTIPWSSDASGGMSMVNPSKTQFEFGHAVATGKFSPQGCPEFNVSVVTKSSGTHGDTVYKYVSNRTICP